MKYLKLTAIFIVPLLFGVACSDGTVVEVVDPNVQLETDLGIITEYINTKGYTEVDTTTSGGIYTVLEVGDGASIENNDIVSFHFILRSAADDLIYQTSIRDIAIEEDILEDTRIYEPEICTYTNGAWFVNALSRVFNANLAELGYKEGVIGSFGKIKIGGRAVIMVPSTISFGSAQLWGLPAYTPLAIEVRPVYKR